jgi:2,4-dienoyl-CoA reductase-like NADH-dependent reductase (Old Yellow Enzyme family)
MELLLDCSSTCLVGSILFLAAVLAGYLVCPSTQKDVSNSTPITRVLPRNRSESLCLSPLRLRKLVLKNRVVRAAAFGGATVNDLIDMHTAVARGGAAMTTIAYAAVSNDGRTFSSQLLLSDEALVPELERLSAAVHEAGAAISIQLTHAGSFADRKVTGEQQVAPSRLFNPAGFDFPREMTEADMARVARQFGDAASLVKRAGFDAVEVHMGHGYLLSQFLCPFTNRRADR